MPRFLPESGVVTVDNLLKVRDSSEAREFRDWLTSVGDADEDEIRNQIAGWRVKAGIKAESTVGKVIRLLTTNLPGFLPPQVGMPLGLALGVLDTFLLSTAIPRTGVACVYRRDVSVDL